MAMTYKSKRSEDQWDIWHSNVNGDEILHTFATEAEADYFLKTGSVGITPAMIEAWQGSDNMNPDDFLCLLADIINGEYPIALFRQDVLEFHNTYEGE